MTTAPRHWFRRGKVEVPSDDVTAVRRPRRSPRVTYPFIGLLLGVGSPLGAFLLRYVALAQVRSRPAEEFSQNAFFYSYLLIGTCAVFAIAGLIAGDRAARLRQAEAFYHRLADHDPLTGLLNTRAFHERYRRYHDRAQKLGTPLALLLVDVDRLKDINDRHGHAAGDEALRHVGDALRKAKRAEDAAARWGGDEFAIVLDGADVEAASRVALSVMERLRVDPLRFAVEEKPVTVTIGLASGRPKAENDLFEAADRALYEGKQSGRNQFRTAGVG